MRIALTGNPNSGKTTMYNALTGKNEKVGNWAGVTVDKKEAPIKKSIFNEGEEIIAVDLPGAYSMSPFTSEESITSSYVRNENPDVIINIVDATNLSRSLFFTTQLLELGIPMVVALNKADINKKKQTAIDVKKLSEVETRKILTKNKNAQDGIDKILTNKWLGIPIFAVIMFGVFWISQAGPGVWIADTLVGWLESLQGLIGDWVSSLGVSDIVYALLIDGVLGGVIAVIGFLPLVMVMYFLIALLEDCGYMARVSVVLDPIFKKVGLSGKSVIPFVIGTGCAIPGVMACRTIRNERERRATAMLAPFMPCGAKLPVISLFAGAFFGDASWVGPLMYFVGIVIIFLGALIVNKITGNKSKRSFFIIELPEYKLPSLLRAFKSMCSRGWSYIVKAATIILVCNTAVQVMQSFNWSFQTIAEGAENTSILATIATPFAYVLIPIVGYHAWQLAAAAVTGFIAKENVVGTLAVCYGIANLIDTEELVLMEGAGTEVAGIFGLTKAAALAYLMFNLFTPPCFAAIGAMNAEMKSSKWLWSGIALQLGVGFTVGYIVYTVGTLITSPASLHVGGALIGGIAVAIMAAIVVYLCINSDKKLQKEK